MRIANASEIEPGGVKLFTYPRPERPLHSCAHRQTNKFVAYSQKCTHLSCAVYYAKDRDRLECPCHEGYFSIEDGRVLQGPPPRPLPRIQLEQRGDELMATGVEEHGGLS